MGSPQAHSDAELAVQLQAGDPAALGQLYDRHVRGIHDFLARFTRDPAAAEDLAQSTFLRAWEGRAALRDPARVRAWLYATAHNLALNHVTRARPTGSVEDVALGDRPDLAPGPEDLAMAGAAAELVWAAASSLEARQYAALDLSVRQELSTREIADVLGVPAGHAAVLVNRAREALGNAVRYLLVARRRDHCERLAALVPAGVRALTAQQRSAVDHHMRRCEDCRDLGARLTSPAELLGALLPVPLPASLGVEGRNRLVAAVRALPDAPAQPQQPSPGDPAGPPRRRPWDGRARWAAGLAALLLLLLLLGGGGAAYLHRPGGAQLTRTAGPGLPGGPSAAGPATSPGATPAASSTPSPSASPSSAAVAAATPRPTPTAGSTPGATPTAGTTPAPPPFGVTGVTVIPLDQRSCQLSRLTQAWFCSFLVAIQVADASGRGDVVQGTLTATDARSGRASSTSFQVTVPSPGSSTVQTGKLSVGFPRCPQGTATATTVPPSATPGSSVKFGAC